METRNKSGLAAAVLVLALAFGVLAAALGVGKAVLWDPLPYENPSRLVELSGLLDENGALQRWGISHLDLLDWRRQNQVFESLSAYTSTGGVTYNLLTPQGLDHLDAELVSHDYFQTLGLAPSLGRFFTAQEDSEPFVHPVAVLSHGLWQRRFGGDPKVVGRKINLSGKEWQVVGVGPEGFRGISDTAQLWVPSSMVPGPEFLEVRRFRWLNGVARLKPGATVEQARQDLDRITAALAQQYPDQNRGIGVKIQPLRELVYEPALAGGLRPVILFAAVLLLLGLVTAAGLLQLARGAGVSRATAVTVSLVAAALGLLLGAWAIRALLPTSGFTFPGFARLGPGLDLAAGLLILAALGGILLAALARRGGIRTLAGIAAAVQVALALFLAGRAGMLSRDFRQEVSRNLGYNPKGLLTLRVDLTSPRYAENAFVARLAGQYVRRLEGLPEVSEAAVTGPTIPTDEWVGGFATAEDHDNPESDDGTYKVLTHGVSPTFFKIMEIPVLQGRNFNWQDTQGYHVIVSEGMARQIWPGQNPLGKRIKFSARALNRPWLTIVGMVGDTQYQGYYKEKRPAPDFYLSVLQQPVRMPMVLNVLARPKPGVSIEDLEGAVRKGVLAVTPDAPIFDVATLESRLDKQTWKARFPVRVAGLLAAVALVLGLAAVYGVVAGRRAGTLRLESEPSAEERPASQRQAAH